MATCPSCGAENVDGAISCTSCDGLMAAPRPAQVVAPAPIPNVPPLPNVPAPVWERVQQAPDHAPAPAFDPPPFDARAVARASDLPIIPGGVRLAGLPLAWIMVFAATFVLLIGGTFNAAASSARNETVRVIRSDNGFTVTSWARFPTDPVVVPPSAYGRGRYGTPVAPPSVNYDDENGASRVMVSGVGDVFDRTQKSAALKVRSGTVHLEVTIGNRSGASGVTPSLRVDLMDANGQVVASTPTFREPGVYSVNEHVPAGTYRLSITARSCSYIVSGDGL